MLVQPTVIIFSLGDRLIRSDGLNGIVSFSHPDFNFDKHISIQIGDDLYALLSSRREKMSVMKYVDACLV